MPFLIITADEVDNVNVRLQVTTGDDSNDRKETTKLISFPQKH